MSSYLIKQVKLLILGRVRKALAPSKTLFFPEKVDFLRFQVSGDGVKLTEAYIQMMKDMCY